MRYFLLSIFVIMISCTNDTITPDGDHEVVYLNIRESCGWNLQLTNEVMIWDFNAYRQDGFLHSDIHLFNADEHLKFGDTLSISFDVLEMAPGDYELAEWQCNRWEGIPVRITELVE